MRHAQSKDLVVMFFYINQVFFSAFVPSLLAR